MADNQSIINFKLTTEADNAGLQSHTAATQADTRAVNEQREAMERVSTVTDNSQGGGGKPWTPTGPQTDTKDSYAPSEDSIARTARATAVGEAYWAMLAKQEAAALSAAAGTETYAIATEGEFLAVEKALAAAQARLPVLAASGAATANLTAQITALQAALSTEAAAEMAAKVGAAELAAEQEALAIAMAEGAAAARAAREAADLYAGQELAAQSAQAEKLILEAEEVELSAAVAAAKLEEAAAHGVNTVAMRESMVVMRELMAGNFSRLAGSASILAGALGGRGLQGAVMSASIAGIIAFEVYEHFAKKIEELNKFLDESAALGDKQSKWPDAVKEKLTSLMLEQDRFIEQTENIGKSMDPLKANMDEYIQSLDEEARATEKVSGLQKKLGEARIQALKDAHKITDEQAIVMKLDLDEKEFEQKLDRELRHAKAKLDAFKATQTEEKDDVGNKKDLYQRLANDSITAQGNQTKVDTQLKDARAELERIQEFLKKETTGKNEGQAEKDEEFVRSWRELLMKDSYGEEGGLIRKAMSKEDADNLINNSGRDEVTRFNTLEAKRREAQQLQENIKQLEGASIDSAKVAEQAKQAAKMAGDVWADAMKSIADLDRKIRSQTIQVDAMGRENAQEKWLSRQTTWQEEVNKLTEEYEKNQKSLDKEKFHETHGGHKGKGTETSSFSTSPAERQKLAERQTEIERLIADLRAHPPQNPMAYHSTDPNYKGPLPPPGLPPKLELPPITDGGIHDSLTQFADGYEAQNQKTSELIDTIIAKMKAQADKHEKQKTVVQGIP